MNKVLVIQTAFLGDVVLTTPLLKAIHNCLSNSTIDILLNPETVDLIKNTPYVKNIIVFDKHKGKIKNFFQILDRIKNKYDIIFLPHKSFTSALLGKFAKARMRIGFNQKNFLIPFLYTHKVKFDVSLPVRKRYLALLEVICHTQEKDIPTELFISNETKIKVDNIFLKYALFPKSYITIAPGSVWHTKRWLTEYYIELINIIYKEMPIILIGGKGDIDIGSKIENNVSEKIINFIGKLNLDESIYIIQNASVLISGDTAPMHFANAVNTPVVAIFGPTVPAFGFAPYRENDIILEDRFLKCRPCSPHGPRKCPLKHHNCMRNIKPEMVKNAIEKIILKEG